MLSQISIDILAIIISCFTISLAKRNIILNRNKNRLYIAALVTTIIMLFLEMATVLMDPLTDRSSVVPYRLANILGFSLSPVVPYLLFLFYSRKENKSNYKKPLAYPVYFNTLICIISYKTGWIFFVDAHNRYMRGNLFLLPTTISMFYFALLVIEIIQNRAEYEKDENKFIIPILLMPVLSLIVQILNKNILLIWGSVSLSLLLYYIGWREQQFKYDVQTQVKNRSTFEKEMKKYLKEGKNAAIIVLDINDLKSINDKYGHAAGDEVIIQAAKIIQDSFKGIGRTFRIGGDEFCVICRETPKQLLDNSLAALDHLLIAINKNRSIKIELAYGYAFYTQKENESIYSSFTQADQAMYRHKASLKSIH